MDLKTLIFTKSPEGIAVVKLNRPEKMNALDMVVREELLAVVKEVAEDKEVRVLVITGTGRAFCAGGDVSTMPLEANPETGYERLKPLHEIVLTLTSIEKPVICALNGYTLGAGLALALLGDILIAAENAKLGAVFVNVALAPDTGAAYFLPRAVGLYKAKELAFTGQMIDAREAERLGLVNKVVPPEELEAATNELAQKLARGPTRTLGLAKKLLNKSFELSLPELLELELHTQASIMMSADFKEGVKAFLEKRPAQFKGK